VTLAITEAEESLAFGTSFLAPRRLSFLNPHTSGNDENGGGGDRLGGAEQDNAHEYPLSTPGASSSAASILLARARCQPHPAEQELLLGDGIRLFAGPMAQPVTLEPVSVGQSGN
jgi:hypothetical protein